MRMSIIGTGTVIGWTRRFWFKRGGGKHWAEPSADRWDPLSVSLNATLRPVLRHPTSQDLGRASSTHTNLTLPPAAGRAVVPPPRLLAVGKVSCRRGARPSEPKGLPGRCLGQQEIVLFWPWVGSCGVLPCLLSAPPSLCLVESSSNYLPVWA